MGFQRTVMAAQSEAPATMRRTRGGPIQALLAVIALAVTALLLAPTAAHASGDPRNWQLPEQVTHTNETVYIELNGGDWEESSVIPGDTFFYAFELTNSSSEPVTVTGFTSNFILQMNPRWDGIYPADHCQTEFFEEVPPMPDRQ